jgi:AmmeMemoRadiSam system protein B/AmmeMemoRadiSam system protein A
VEIARFAREPQPINLIEPGALMKTMQPTRPAGPPRPSPGQQDLILAAAAEFVAAAIVGRPVRLADPALAGAATVSVIGAYVTLKRRGQLRACCGSLGETRKLIETLHQASVITAREDHRLPPISPTELPFLDLSVNLLHRLERMEASGRDRVAAVEVGRHGLRIHRGNASGLLLPTVPVENRWDAESYLRHVCRKAGLPTTAWEDEETVLYTFESVEFGGPFDPGAGADVPGLLPIGPAELQQLAEHARANVVALAQGLTPSYYMYGGSDGNITGLGLTVNAPGLAEPHHFVQLSMRPGVPLQATLFQLCEHAAQAVRRSNLAPGSIRVGVTVFTDPAMHGTVREPDLRGLDPRERALLMIEHDKNAWIYAPSGSPESHLDAARGRVTVLNPSQAALYSLAARSTEPEFVFHSAPRPVPGARTRPPAVAGTFYPADADELARKVEGFLGATDRREEDWPAAMVPHAGLSFSGALAGAVFQRLKIPELVLILGPKHTRLGVDWSVAPHEIWSIPGASIPSDPALARALAEAIPGLQLDAAAHQQEHAIEVELPFLARLAPGTRVLGLAIGGGDWERCRRFAEGLAEFVRRLPSRPLLVISSDMNHFATDRENRRLDEIALEAMERLDPAHLLATVTEHQISMCGVLPAVIVMEALRRLGGLSKCERVGYATSADVTGDTSRVVGYAGVLMG